MNIDELVDKACHEANGDLPEELQEIQDYLVLDSDGEVAGRLTNDEQLMAAYIAGQQRNERQ